MYTIDINLLRKFRQYDIVFYYRPNLIKMNFSKITIFFPPESVLNVLEINEILCHSRIVFERKSTSFYTSCFVILAND